MLDKAPAKTLTALLGFNRKWLSKPKGKLWMKRFSKMESRQFLTPARRVLAEVGGHLVGSLLITYEWSDWRNATFWWIQSVFVEASWRRKGVYRSMHDYVSNIADSREDICGIRLYVERSNTIAQQTYNDLGMAHSHYDLYEIDFVL